MKLKNGFTLIEIIIFFVLLAIFATYLSLYMQTTVTKLNNPIASLTNTTTLLSAMSDITNKYYALTQGGDASTVLDDLKEYVTTTYAQYSPQAVFITDLASAVASESKTDILKVTIGDDSSGSLTSYFMKP